MKSQMCVACGSPASLASLGAADINKDHLTCVEGSLRGHCQGVIRRDEGSVEMTVSLAKPNNEFFFFAECAYNVLPAGK